MRATITRKDLEGHASQASISDVQHLSSYSWIDLPEPTIAVPGMPPKWQPPKKKRRGPLPKDSGLQYLAENEARHPDSPMEPLFRAVYSADPSFDVRNIDVVTDAKNIRKLLSFVDPASARLGLQPFTIHAELEGESTVTLSSVEARTSTFIMPTQFEGYGLEYKKAYTAREIANSTGHYRVIKYSFGGLNYVVRFEADAYVDPPGSEPQADSKSEDPIADIINNVDHQSLGSGSKLSVRKQGRIIPLDSILKIKPRVGHSPLKLFDLAPPLWISQTRKLVCAYHYQGEFEETYVEDVVKKITTYERMQQPSFERLAALMTKLTEQVKSFGGSCAIKCYSRDADELVVQRIDGKPMLPLDLYSKWDTA
ncbi:hypothetical protein PG997_002856 [Apiospora hydei]|uniref:Geranylgeranyl pyrophosphate synthetase n=1 Tax=Apiospora hydei TaxID=1337664 RepID=A0ABR1WXK8_9PEZI